MGRSVMTHPNAIEIIFRTIDSDEFDEYGYLVEYDYLVDWVRESFIERFPSMGACERWARGSGAMGELRCVVANDLCDVYISDYCGMAAISIVPTGLTLYNEDTSGLAYSWCEAHAAPFARRVFAEYDPVATASNGETFYRRVES